MSVPRLGDRECNGIWTKCIRAHECDCPDVLSCDTGDGSEWTCRCSVVWVFHRDGSDGSRFWRKKLVNEPFEPLIKNSETVEDIP